MHVHARTAACLSPYAPPAFPPPAYADKLDYVVCEDGKVIGRIYEDWHTLPDLRWFWSITVYVDPKQGINTGARGAWKVLANWQKVPQ
jgi:hypothetical protein